MSKHESNTGTIKTAHRVFDVLELACTREGITVSGVADEVGIAVSTAHGYLTTLEDLGYLVRENDRFHLTLGFFRYGNAAQERFQYLGTIEQTLEKVAEKTGEAVWYVAKEQGKPVHLIKKEGDDAVRTSGRVGKQAPLHASAAGKAILVDKPDERISEIDLPKYTDETITDPGTLLEEINEIRKTGVSYNDNEHLVGLRAVGSPIQIERSVIGAIVIGGPSERIQGEYFHEEIPKLLREAANEIKLELTEPNF